MDIRHFKKGAKQEKEAKQDAKKIDPQKIRPEDIERLKKFRANPSDESWIHA